MEEKKAMLKPTPAIQANQKPSAEKAITKSKPETLQISTHIASPKFSAVEIRYFRLNSGHEYTILVDQNGRSWKCDWDTQNIAEFQVFTSLL